MDRKKTVVVVDDEPITRLDICDMAEEEGYELLGSAADGFDAIELCRKKRPDIVLMDVKMPIFDGMTAAELMLSEKLAGCVVLLTALSDEDIIERAGKIGVTGYLVKPIDQNALRPAIEVAYAQSRRLSEAEQKIAEAEAKMTEERRIRKAQQYLMKTRGCDSETAYAMMRKTAMDKRMSIATIAEAIMRQAGLEDHIEKAKAMLMNRRGLSEGAAYSYISANAEKLGISKEESAQKLIKAMENEHAQDHM